MSNLNKELESLFLKHGYAMGELVEEYSSSEPIVNFSIKVIKMTVPPMEYYHPREDIQEFVRSEIKNIYLKLLNTLLKE